MPGTTASGGVMSYVTVGQENSAAIRIYYEDHGQGAPAQGCGIGNLTAAGGCSQHADTGQRAPAPA